MFPVFPDPVRLIRDQHTQKQFNQDQQMLRRHTEATSASQQTDVNERLQSILTSAKTANSTIFVLLMPPPSNNSCSRGDSSSSQQLDTTETKLRTSKAIWKGDKDEVSAPHDLPQTFQLLFVFPADLPHAHVGSGGGEGFAEELADLVGVRSDLR